MDKIKEETIQIILKRLQNNEMDWDDRIGEEINLNELRRYLSKNIIEGVKCPCCSLNVQLSQINLTKSLIKPMAILYQLSNLTIGKYIHKDEVYKIYGKQVNTLGKLTYWNFIVKGEHIPTDDGNPNDAMYCITPLGVDFLMGKTKVKKTVFTFNKKQYRPPVNHKMEYVYYNQTMNEVFNFNKHVSCK